MERRAIARQLEQSFCRPRPGRATQVVTLNTAPADLRARVLRDGILLLDRDTSARIRFEMQTRNEWFDLQPILREYRRMGTPAE